MLILAWISVIIYGTGMLLGTYKRIYEGEGFLQFICNLSFQGCIMWCLIYLIMLL